MKRTKRTFANISQIASGRWQVRYTDPHTTARRYAPHTFRTRIDAEAFVVDLRRRFERGERDQPRRAPITFGEYSTTWLKNRHVADRPIKPRTRAHYAAILEDHLLPTFANKPVAAIAPQDVRSWHAATLVDKPTMRSHAYSLLRTIMASAVNDEVIDANPCHIPGAGRTSRKHVIKVASVDELEILTREMPDRLQLMVILASWCAMRFGEIVELRRGDVDLSGEVIRVRRAASRVGGRFEITTPKSDAGVRDVHVPPHVLPVIEDHLANHVGADSDSLLFPGDNGKHLQPSTLARHWRRARKAAGRDDLRFHDLRHSGAVLAARTGASLAELMARLGHSSPQAAMRYQHAVAGRDREIAALMSKLAANT